MDARTEKTLNDAGTLASNLLAKAKPSQGVSLDLCFAISSLCEEIYTAVRKLKAALKASEFTIVNGSGAFGGFEGLARSAADAATQSAILDSLVRVGELMLKAVSPAETVGTLKGPSKIS